MKQSPSKNLARFEDEEMREANRRKSLKNVSGLMAQKLIFRIMRMVHVRANIT